MKNKFLYIDNLTKAHETTTWVDGVDLREHSLKNFPNGVVLEVY